MPPDVVPAPVDVTGVLSSVTVERGTPTVHPLDVAVQTTAPRTVEGAPLPETSLLPGVEHSAHTGREIGASGDLLRILKSGAGVIEPVFPAPVCRPIAARALDSFERGERREVFFQPAAQQTPLPQQRLMRRLDCDFAGILRHVGGEQVLGNEQVYEWTCFGRDLRHAGDPAARAASFGIDAGKPRDETPAQQYEPR